MSGPSPSRRCGFRALRGLLIEHDRVLWRSLEGQVKRGLFLSDDSVFRLAGEYSPDKYSLRQLLRGFTPRRLPPAPTPDGCTAAKPGAPAPCD
jgi:hypothetical protein